jgi:hypothetical protein
VIESVVGDIRLRLAEFFLSDELDPVTIWIERKRNVLHPPIREFLLEFNSLALEAETGVLQRAHGNTNMSKTTSH